jgi:catechol 2,3-dioxygenase
VGVNHGDLEKEGLTMVVREEQQKRHTVSTPFKARRLAHVNLSVGDIERSKQFYRNVVGLEMVYQKALNTDPASPVGSAFFSNGNTHHDVAVGSRGMTPGVLNHMAFELENEVDLIDGYHQAVGKGTEFQLVADHIFARSLYRPDPDNNGVEIYADTTKDWRGVRGDGRLVRGDELSPPWTPGDPPRFAPPSDRNYHVDPEIRRMDDSIFHAKRITHLVIVAADYPALYDYYTSYVGLTPLAGGLEDKYTILSGTTGGHQVTLFQGKDGQKTGLHHFGFEVWSEQELEESEIKLKKSGVTPAFSLDHQTRRSVFVNDPDGFLVEFFVNRAANDLSLEQEEEELSLYLA